MWLRNLRSGALVATYVLGGALVHLVLERNEEGGRWTFVDCLYFVSMTMSTVGYGDLSPTSEGTRWWTVLMIILGVSLVFPLLASMFEGVTSPLTKAGRDVLDRMFPQTGADIEGDGSVDYKIPRHPIIFYSKNLLPSLLLNLVVQLISAGIFCALEKKWTFSDAFYHCLVTCTTVGYGDVKIATQAGRGWAAIHMVVAVILVAELLSTISELSSQRAETLKRIEQLQRRADANLLEKLQERVKRIRAGAAVKPDGSQDSQGITELEFTVSMLIELEMVSWDHAELFIKQFRKFDATGDGRLDAADLRSHLDKQKSDIDQRLAVQRSKSLHIRGRHGAKHGTILPAQPKAEQTVQSDVEAGQAAPHSNCEEISVSKP